MASCGIGVVSGKNPMRRAGLVDEHSPMGRLKDLQWFLVLGLGAFALVRPLLNVVGVTERLGKPQTQLAVTALVTLVWVAVVGFTRVAEPLLTLVFAGLAYGVFAIVLSGVLSPVLLGELQGPLAHPPAIVEVLVVNALWGLIAGLLAVGVRRLRHAPMR